MTNVYLSLLLSLLLPLRSKGIRGQLPPILFLVLVPAAFLVANTTIPLTGHVLDPTQIDDVPSAPSVDSPTLEEEAQAPLEPPLSSAPSVETTELVFPDTPFTDPDTNVDLSEPPIIDPIQEILPIDTQPDDSVDILPQPEPSTGAGEVVIEPPGEIKETTRTELKITLQLPDTVTRGSSFPVSVLIENIGTQEAVRIRPHLVLPVGFSALETSRCPALSPGSTCVYTAEISTTKYAEAGLQDISVEVAYA